MIPGNYKRIRLAIACLILVLLVKETGFGQQNRIAAAVAKQQQAQQPLEIALFEKVNRQEAVIDAEIRNVIYLKLNKAALQEVNREKASLVTFPLPLGPNEAAGFLTLRSFNVLSPDFKLYAQGSNGSRKEVPFSPGIFYRGMLKDAVHSVVACTFLADEVAAVFSTLSQGNYNLVLNYENPGADRDNYILFREADIIHQERPDCAVTDSWRHIAYPLSESEVQQRETYSSCNLLKASLHADYKLYQRKGQSVSATSDYITSVFNGIATMLANEGIQAAISEIIVHDAPDAYTYGGSAEVLHFFGEQTKRNFSGDVVHMISGYQVSARAPLGGLAWLDVLCRMPDAVPDGMGGQVWVGPYSMSNPTVLAKIPDIPIYSWDINVTTHELGHSIGSPHTQSCSWPGGPIDNCVAVEGGNCSPGPRPGSMGGTMMSYCHLDRAIGVNFSLGFVPLPGNLIRQKVATASCLGTTAVQNVLDSSDRERIANRLCSDGDWTYYYYDNNTASFEDDELLLMIKTNGQDIGNVDLDGFDVRIKTTPQYQTGKGRGVTAPYADSAWTEMNRTWMVALPAGKQPAAEVSIRFPFTEDDMHDVQGSLPGLIEANQLMLVAFNNQNASDNAGAAELSDVMFYTNSGTANDQYWRLGKEGKYNYAEFTSAYGVFGGSMGFKPSLPTALAHFGDRNKSLMVYPNPALNEVFIRLQPGWSSRQYVEVYDHLGRMMMREQIPALASGAYKLNVNSLAAGNYVMRYVQDTKAFTALWTKK